MREMKFYCIQTRKRYKYSKMSAICGTCNFPGRCNAHAVADRRGYINNPAALLGLFSRWFDK